MVESVERDRARLSEAQKTLLEKRLREGADSARGRAARIPRRPAGETAPLSFSQQRLWMLHQLDGGGSAYNVPVAIELRGPLDISGLRSALGEMVRRHESLRTRFAESEGSALQRIDEDFEVELPVVDLVPIPELVRGGEVRRLVREESERPFDLESGPVLRVSLLRLEIDRHILVWVAHHIVSDGWSLGVVTRELPELYRAAREARPSPLPELPIQYADFACWQREWFRGERLRSQLDYWRRELSGIETLNLPLDRPRPSRQSFRGKNLRVHIPQELVSGLKELGRRENASLFMVLLAGFQALLHRYSGQEDIVVGSPIANRSRVETEGLIGFFVNSLVMRGDFSGRPSFRRALRRVRERALGAFSHQDLPFEKLVEEIRPERKLSQNPLFQVMFVLQNAPSGSFELPGLELAPVDLELTSTRFDLELHASERSDGLSCTMFYATDLFDGRTVERMLAHYRRLLEAFVADPDAAVGDLDLLNEAEEREVSSWNDTARELPEVSVHQLFEARVRETPEATAVRCGEETSSYAELDRRANHLARHLRKLGVGAEVPVAICLERSIEAVIGLLGISKSGGFYVPLDPAYPAERLKWMIADSRAKVVITDEEHRTLFPEATVSVLTIDGPGPLEEGVDGDLETVTSPDNLAYVIYTSGSTGRPKGVAVTHRAVNRLVWNTNYIDITPEDRVAQASNLSFDAATFEVWGALSRGASLVIIPREVALSPDLYAQEIERCGVTTLFLTTALFNQMARERVEAFGSLKHLCFGGEAVDPAYVRRVLADGKPGRLLHVYGPTESTTYATWQLVEEVEEEARTVPVGSALANTEIHVLDREMRPVPVGIPGELFIGGLGLARGYLDRPELTAEKFLPNPLGAAGSRLYRTGDRVRRCGDGAIEFLGRVDHQVKIRGFRVEPGEIESAMLAFAGVRDAVVIAGEDVSGSKRLCAYLVAELDGGGEGRGDTGETAQREQVSRWRKTYEEVIYGEISSEATSPTFNIVGWNSSYTGKPLSSEAMREQVTQTVARIAAVRPERVLEIGCGTGLLLFELAPDCSRYVGTDFSPMALAYVEEHLESLGARRSVVSLMERPANDWSGIEAGSFDAVVLNSIIQYFPSVSYLLEVLEGAVGAVRDGGHIFVGDVRHLGLGEVFHTAVQLHQSGPEATIERIESRARQRFEQEQELLVTPDFFRGLGQRLGRVKAVRVQPKRGRDRNELTEFRYDVILQVGGTAPSVPEVESRDWKESGLDMSKLESALTVERPPALLVTGIPNQRISRWVDAHRLIREGRAPEKVEALVELLANGAPAVDPEDLWALSKTSPYRVELSWLSGSEDGSYDALFVRRDLPFDGGVGFPEIASEREIASDLSWFGNEPWKGGMTRGLIPRLREYLGQKLPEYMVPSVLVQLDAFPLTPNGKVDRDRLPAPDSVRPELEVGYVAPRGPIEEGIASIFGEVLGLSRIGVHDDFFELGGHSLMATQVISRVRKAFQVEIPLRTLFESKTVAGLSGKVVEALGSGASSEAPPIERQPTSDGMPLSFAQQRLWFLDRLEPGNTAYNMWHAFRLAGPLAERALERSLKELVRRHESLRTTFVTIDGTPVQRIGSEEAFAFDRRDLRGIADRQAREEEARRLVRGEAFRPFDLTEGPVFRVLLLRVDEEDRVLLLTMHHIVSDGWSKGIVMRELSALYEAYRLGEASPLPEPAIQYSDYARWQREWLAGAVLDRELGYWREKLSGAPAALLLPFDRPRPRRQTFRGGQQIAILKESLTKDLKDLSRKSGVTTFMTLLSALKVLLSRYSGETDISVGTPIANRNRADIEGLVGFFLNTLVLRTDLSGNPSFDEALVRERDVCLSAYAHQNVPFEKLLEELHPERDLTRNPLFQVFFNMLTFEEEGLRLGESKVSSYPTESEGAKFDLTLYVMERGGRFAVVASYNRDLWDESTVRRILSHYERTLEQCVSKPREKVAGYDLWTDEDGGRLPDPALELDEVALKPVWELVLAQAQRNPESVAIRQGGRDLRYGELCRSVEVEARRLSGEGLERGDVVAVRGSRDVEMVVSMCAVLRAGGAFLLLDPSLPEERLRVMVSEARAKRLSREGRTDENTPMAPLPPVRGGDSAYVFFTSGSTGTPKGVLGTHKGLSHFVEWERERFGIGAGDRVAQLTSPSFDAILRDVFLPLVSGGCLVLPDEGMELGTDGVLRWLSREGITVLHTVPTLMESWLSRVPEDASFGRLRWVLFSGEPLTMELARKCWTKLGAVSVVNLYGPTETTMTKCFHVVSPDEPEGVVPLGEAMPQTQALVLREDDGRCALGELGEIVIRTPYGTRGYLNGADENRSRFRPNVYREAEGDVLYYTGDRGRYRGDGKLEYLGRKDGQLKVRGARVEPSEVEQVLNQHPSVLQSAVVARTGEQGTTLAAYLVWRPGATVVAGALRSHLRERLPEYMVPKDFAVVPTLPLTLSGKLDRQRLSELRPSADDVLHATSVGPRNPVEEKLVSIMAAVLGRETVSVEDDFFALGGHSLLATRYISGIREAFGVEIPLRAAFHHPTVESMGSFLDARLREDRPAEAPAIVALPRQLRRAAASKEASRSLVKERG